MQRILLLACCSIFSLLATAQYSISGKLSDTEDKTAIQGATVSLLKKLDNSTVANTVTLADGQFAINNLAADSFILKINSLTHAGYTKIIQLSTASVDLGSIELLKKGKELGAVVVTAQGSAVVNKADTTQYSASQYKVNPDATTEDLIKKMPGISVARDGTVTAQGETVRKVTIDGKDFFGDDASAALKNLPSEVVDKIQVFDKLSDQAQLSGVDDGNSVKAINVVTKSGIKNGQFGRVYAGIGTNERYQAGGNMSTFSGNRRISLVANFNNINQQNFGSQDLLGVTSSGGRGGTGGRGGGRGFGGGESFMVGQSNGISRTNAFGINYSDMWGKKMTVSGSYFYNNSRNESISDIKSQVLDKDAVWYNDNSASNAVTLNTNHRINFRAEYKIDSNNSIFIIPSINFQTNESDAYTDAASYYGAGDSLTKSITKTSRNSNGYNIRNNIMYRHQFSSKKGRMLSLGFNTAFSKNNNENILDGNYRYFDSLQATTDSLPNQFYDNVTNGRTIGGSINYVEPIFKNAVLQFEYNPSMQKNSADQQAFNYNNGKYSDFVPRLSNKFDNTITTHNGGISFRYSPNRDNMLMAGANYQYSNLQSDRIYPTVSNVNQSFSNILPRLMWRKKFSTKSSFMSFYRASVNFPSVSQLQDVVNLSNPLRISIGNPYLKQAYSHNLMARYSFANSKTSRSFFVNLFGQVMNNYISTATYLIRTDTVIQNNNIIAGSQLSKPINLNGYKNIRTLMTYTLPVKFIKSNLSLNAGASYSKLPGFSNSLEVNTDNYAYNAGITLASNISEYVDFNLGYNANFNDAITTSPISKSENNYVNQTTSLQLNLLNKKGWFIQNDISNQTYSGLSAGFNQSYWLWNAAIGKKFLANKKGELKLSVFDLLKQNQAITRTIQSNYIEDARYNVLQQYFMLTFTYNLKNFGKGKAATSNDEGGRPAGMPPGPPPGGGGMF